MFLGKLLNLLLLKSVKFLKVLILLSFVRNLQELVKIYEFLKFLHAGQSVFILGELNGLKNLLISFLVEFNHLSMMGSDPFNSLLFIVCL